MSLAIHHLALRTHRVEALAQFYCDVLDLRVARRTERSVWLALEGAVLMIERAEEDEALTTPGTLELLAMRVDPTGRDQVEARLVALGVEVEARTEHTSYFRDPEGRRLAVSTHPLLGA